MKQQIARFSLHQNAKVVAVISAVWSLIFMIPMYMTTSALPDHGKVPGFLFVVLPVVYLVFGYLATAIGCAVYNFCAKYTGGIEFESGQPQD